MYDSVDSPQGSASQEGWLLLIHQIPPKPDYFRVRVRRHLQRLGAVAIKSSVYVLPLAEETVEDFQWLRRSIVEDGGEATLCTASFLEGVNDEEIVSLFRAQADGEYDEIIQAAAVSGAPTDGDLRRLERQLAQVRARDFFHADQFDTASSVIREIRQELAHRRDEPVTPSDRGQIGTPHGAIWVTRNGVHVDRMASAWLIQRFIDPKARLKFVPATGYEPSPEEIRFDMFEGEFTHVGDKCTFEVLLDRFGLGDPGLRKIGEIVHDIDCKDEKFGRPEAAGVATVIHGITLAHRDDQARIAAGSGMFNGLYASFRHP